LETPVTRQIGKHLISSANILIGLIRDHRSRGISLGDGGNLENARDRARLERDVAVPEWKMLLKGDILFQNFRELF